MNTNYEKQIKQFLDKNFDEDGLNRVYWSEIKDKIRYKQAELKQYAKDGIFGDEDLSFWFGNAEHYYAEMARIARDVKLKELNVLMIKVKTLINYYISKIDVEDDDVRLDMIQEAQWFNVEKYAINLLMNAEKEYKNQFEK